MNVLTVSHMYPRKDNPMIGVFIKRRVEALSKLCSLTVFVPLSPYHPAWKVIKEPENTDIHPLRYLKFPKSILYSTEGFLLSISLLLKILFSGKNFYLIHADTVYPDGTAAVLASKLLNKPVVVTAHGSDLNLLPSSSLPLKKIIAWTLRNSDHVITVSTNLKSKAVELAGFPEKISVISNASADPELFKPMDQKECRSRLGVPEGKIILLYVGNILELKGLPILFQSIKEIKDVGEDFIVYLVGSGKDKFCFEALVADQGLSEHVVFAGSRNPSEIPLWMNACDVFVLPSISEGMPNVVVEAVACGKPVIATRVGGIPDFVTDQNGIIVAPGSVPQLTKAISMLVNDKRLRDKLGRNSLQLCNSNDVGWDAIASRVYDIYLKLTGS